MNHISKLALLFSAATSSTALAAETVTVNPEAVLITATQSSGTDTDVIVPVVEEAVEESNKEDNCTGVLMLSAQAEYPLQDLGIDVSNGTPVTQNMIGAACGKFFFDIWTSTELSFDGVYGERGGGDEIDIEASYTDTVDSPIGEIRYTGKVAFFMVDTGEGLNSLNDDFLVVTADIGRPISIGSATFEPYVYLARFTGVSTQGDFSIVRPGARLSGPLDSFSFPGVSYNLEVAHAWNDASFGDQNVWRGELTFSKSISDSWTVTAGAKATENIGITPLVRMNFLF